MYDMQNFPRCVFSLPLRAFTCALVLMPPVLFAYCDEALVEEVRRGQASARALLDHSQMDYRVNFQRATEKNGPWYILTPEFALPHARPDEGVLSPHSVLSLVCCAEAVAFPDHPDVRLIIVLAAADSEQHIQTIQRLVCWLDEGERLQRYSMVQNRAQFIALLASH